MNEKLVGNWRLVSFTWDILATGESKDVYGKESRGFLTYSRDGRMLVLLVLVVGEGRPKPADPSKMTPEESMKLMNTLVAYGGTYEFDGKTVTHHVDLSANETWTGTDFVRSVVLDGNRMTLRTPPTMGLDGNQGTASLTFQRCE